MINATLDHDAVARRAREILKAIKDSDFYLRLKASSLFYPDCWATFTGYPIVANWNLALDAEPLFREALRVLALKSAIHEQTGGDEHTAELVISAPVDEMVHAVLAQYTLCGDAERALGFRFVHMTDQERFGYERGGLAHQLYVTTYGEEPPARYWIDKDETDRRLAALNDRYKSIGFQNFGRQHNISFEFEPEQELTGVS